MEGSEPAEGPPRSDNSSAGSERLDAPRAEQCTAADVASTRQDSETHLTLALG